MSASQMVRRKSLPNYFHGHIHGFDGVFAENLGSQRDDRPAQGRGLARCRAALSEMRSSVGFHEPERSGDHGSYEGAGRHAILAAP